MDQTLYMISDKAYNTLIDIAVMYGYLKPGMRKVKGMSVFLAELSKSDMIDTRPENVKERHRMEISFGRAPIWSSYYMRRVRSLRLDDDTMARFVNTAYDLGIIKREEPWLIGGPSRINLTSIISYVLESIGLGWITPVKVRANTFTKRTCDE